MVFVFVFVFVFFCFLKQIVEKLCTGQFPTAKQNITALKANFFALEQYCTLTKTIFSVEELCSGTPAKTIRKIP
jgi:hypothetical protein